MAYGKNFEMRFKNRITGDIYRAEIWAKGYSGAVTELTGAETPFTAAYQDQDILEPIKAVELTLSFLNNGLKIEDFYSDDDEAFRVDFFCEVPADKLLYSGYLIEDGASEPVTDRKHVITLKATDNLALLKNVHWNEAAVYYYGQHNLLYFITYSLKQTGLFSPDSTIDQSLPLRVFDNLFENTTEDRGDYATADPFNLTYAFSGIFQNSDGTWMDCFTILTQILKDLNAVLYQAEGCWNIVRIPEYKYFTSGAIMGSQYDYNGVAMNVTSVTLNPFVIIDRNGVIEPVLEDQQKSIQRPLRYVKDTFNYNTPDNLIKNLDLKEIGNFRQQFTDGSGNTVKEYDLPDWYLTPTTGAGTYDYWIRVVYDPGGIETDRYIVVSHSSATVIAEILSGGVYVNKNDRIDVSFQFRTENSEPGPGNIVFNVTLDDGTNLYKLNYNNGTTVNGSWSTTGGIQYGYASGVNLQDYQTVDVTSLNIPVDGWLNIWLSQAQKGGGKTYFKEIKASFTAFINDNTEITGQTHLDTGGSLIKAVQENDIQMDDSPRNFIPGTLLTDHVTSFGTPLPPNPGTYYVTKTVNWHRVSSTEALRLGNIITQEILRLSYTARTIIEGSFKPLRHDTDKYISPLTLFQIGFLAGKYFLAGRMEIDYMQNTFSAKLIEIFKDDESDFMDIYQFSYIYK